jgi:16S rRNA (guanine966-N2)-methyltransferase
VSRIIAGSRGGRRIAMPPGDKTRPTTDRVREALFSAIAAWAGTADAPAEEALAGLAFADLYAGSGAVGLEAASRGADPVLLVEGNKRTALVSQRNVGELRLPARVRTLRVEQLVAQPAPQPFDVVFLDPPYDVASSVVAEVLAALAEHGWLMADALVVVERSRRSADFGWPVVVGETWTRGYGETVLHFGSCVPAPADPAGTLPEQQA